MKKTIVTAATVAAAVFGSAFFTETIHAEQSQESIQNERSEVKEDLSKAESEVADILTDIEKINREIEELDSALKKNQKAIDETEEKIEKNESEIADLEEEINDLEEKIEKRYNLLKDRAVSLQKNGGNIGYLEVIFGSKSFGDFINRISAVSKISDSDRELIEQQEADKKRVEDNQAKIEEKLKQLEDEKVEIEGITQTINDQKKVNKKKAEQAKSKKEKLNDKIASLKLEDKDLAALEEEANRRVSQSESSNNTESDSSTTVVNNSSNDDGGELSTLSSKSNSSKPKTSGNGNISAAINAGFDHLGTPYVTGGKKPGGFDCSGFVSWAFKQAGYNIPSYTGSLAGTGKKVSYSQAQPGDLVFFDTYKKNGHVGIYLGGGEFIGAQSTPGLAVADMTSGYWKEKFNGLVRRVQ